MRTELYLSRWMLLGSCYVFSLNRCLTGSHSLSLMSIMQEIRDDEISKMIFFVLPTAGFLCRLLNYYYCCCFCCFAVIGDIIPTDIIIIINLLLLLLL